MVLQASGAMSIPATVSVDNQLPASWMAHYNCADGKCLFHLKHHELKSLKVKSEGALMVILPSSVIPVKVLGCRFRLSLISGDSF